MKIESIFPSTLGISINKNHFEQENDLVKYCLKQLKTIKKGGDLWASKVYNTCGTKEIVNVEEFKILNNWIFKEVSEYAKEIGFAGKNIITNSSWFNVYNQNDYQEYHDHGGSDISAVYFLKSTKESANLIFKSNEPSGFKHVFVKDNPYTWKRFFIPPHPGQLVVFKSHMQHCVEQHKTNEIRITLAYNFKVE
jgi:uncharacterized protein (TIGR02466 family)